MTKLSNQTETIQNLDLDVIPVPTDPITKQGVTVQTTAAKQAAEARITPLSQALERLGIPATFRDVHVGNNLAIYTYTFPAKTTFPTSLKDLQNNLADLLDLHRPARIQLTENVLTLTIDNNVMIPVDFRDLIAQRKLMPPSIIAGVAGMDAFGRNIDFELNDKVPHALLFGRTGAGKTVMIMDILYSIMSAVTPDQLKIAYIDGKGNSFDVMRTDAEAAKSPNYYHPNPFTYTQPADAAVDYNYARALIKHLERETQKRVELLKQKGVSNLADFNEQFPEQAMPEILLVVDEFSAITDRDRDLKASKLAQKSATEALIFMAKMGRPVGIHLFLANQSARKEQVPGKLSTNIPGRLSLSVSEGVESYIALPESNVDAHLIQQQGEFYSTMNGVRNPEQGNTAYLPDKVMFALNDSLEKKLGHHDYVVSRQAILAEMNDD